VDAGELALSRAGRRKRVEGLSVGIESGRDSASEDVVHAGDAAAIDEEEEDRGEENEACCER
jgi:hypothetical protein